MMWYLTIRADPGYSRTADPNAVATFLASLPELARTGVNTFGNAPGQPWVRVTLAMSDHGSYADHGLPHLAINLVDIVCGSQHDDGWHDSLAQRIASFLDWEALDEHAERIPHDIWVRGGPRSRFPVIEHLSPGDRFFVCNLSDDQAWMGIVEQTGVG